MSWGQHGTIPQLALLELWTSMVTWSNGCAETPSLSCLANGWQFHSESNAVCQNHPVENDIGDWTTQLLQSEHNELAFWSVAWFHDNLVSSIWPNLHLWQPQLSWDLADSPACFLLTDQWNLPWMEWGNGMLPCPRRLVSTWLAGSWGSWTKLDSGSGTSLRSQRIHSGSDSGRCSLNLI